MFRLLIVLILNLVLFYEIDILFVNSLDPEMEKKLLEMNEAFEHLRFAECLSIIDQLVKKFSKPDKKNKALGPTELKVIKCFKVGSLVSLGRHHEAHHIYSNNHIMQNSCARGRP